MRNHCLDAALEELAKAGVRAPTIAPGAKHPQIRWQTPQGELRCFSVPGTSSDYRAPENVRRDIRRMLRADGMIEAPAPRVAPVRQPSRIELLERRMVEI